MSKNTAAEYRKNVGETTILTYSGSEFRLKVIDFMDYMKIVRGLREDFPDDVTDDTMFSVASDATRPHVLYAYAEKALPLSVLRPPMVAKNLDEEGKPLKKTVLGVDEVAPMDVLKLTMATVMGATDVRLLMESFPGQ